MTSHDSTEDQNGTNTLPRKRGSGRRRCPAVGRWGLAAYLPILLPRKRGSGRRRCPAVGRWGLAICLLLSLPLIACSSPQPPPPDDEPTTDKPTTDEPPPVTADETDTYDQPHAPPPPPEPNDEAIDEPTPVCDELQREADADPILPDLLDEYLSDDAQSLLDDPETHRFQVLVGELHELDDGVYCVVEHGFRVDAEYFYPASSIKTVASVVTLQTLEDGLDVDLDEPLWFHNPDDFEALPDDFTDDGFEPERFDTLRNIIDDTQIVSSNPGYNRLFDLAGHEALNRWTRKAGLESLRLRHRFFSDRTPEQEKWSPRVSVQRGGADAELEPLLPPRRSTLELPPLDIDGQEIGDSYIDAGEVFDEPMDFTEMNYLSVADHQRMMIEIMRPAVIDGVHFEGLAPHRELLWDAMLRDPVDFADERGYDLGDDAQRRFKPALSGVVEAVDGDRVRYYNKGGRAYGFHIENAFIALDDRTGRGVFVTAVAYVNENRRLNDNDYEYDEISFPFFHDLGTLIAEEFLTGDHR